MPFNYRKELDGLDKTTRDRVVALYEKADEIMQKRVRQAIEREITIPKINSLVKFNEELMRAVLRKTAPEVQNAVQGAFLAGANNIEGSIPRGKIMGAFEALTGAEREQAAAIVQDHYLRFAQTLQVVSNSTRKVLSDGLRRQIRDRVALGTLTGDSIEEIARDLRNNIFTPSGMTGFIKSNGARMSLGDYSRTLTRMMIIESGTEGSRARMGTLGITVFQISEHIGGAEDDACASHQGKIYSTTGGAYPKPNEEDFPPYHPNCRHVINARPDLQS